MPGAEPRLYLPYRRWPADDRLLWERAMGSDDPFTNAAGACLAKASQHSYLFGWRRFLGFLAINEPTALELLPSERPTIERVRAFVSHLAETNTPRSVANQVQMFYLAARLMMPERDWIWLKAVKARLFAAAPANAANGPSSPASSCSTLASSLWTRADRRQVLRSVWMMPSVIAMA